MKRITDWIHAGLRSHLRPGDWAVDATLGNGHDALVLGECVGVSGKVWGIDLQQGSIESSRERLAELSCFEALHGDHAQWCELLPAEALGRLRAVVFNLGYLPGADHGCTTRRESTLPALVAAMEWISPGGVLACTCYPRREESRLEGEAVSEWAEGLALGGTQVTRIGSVGTRKEGPFSFWLQK